MILVDTSIWVDHLRRGNTRLAALLHAEWAATHPFVIGELACGGIRDRTAFLTLLAALPTLGKADDDEVLHFIDEHQLAGAGLGLVDVHLLASCVLDGCAIWTLDRALATAARKVGCAAAPDGR
ncbi:MAG: PIN domain-containing protein [Planctomycetes bacterium]|nr:PIN domain-containing protein [Planctomycetota bacterium]